MKNIAYLDFHPLEAVTHHKQEKMAAGEDRILPG